MTICRFARSQHNITCCTICSLTTVSSNFSFRSFFSCINSIRYVLSSGYTICSRTCNRAICTSSNRFCINIVFNNTSIIDTSSSHITIFEVQSICQGYLFCSTIICFVRQVCLSRYFSTIDCYFVVLSCAISTCCTNYS